MDEVTPWKVDRADEKQLLRDRSLWTRLLLGKWTVLTRSSYSEIGLCGRSYSLESGC